MMDLSAPATNLSLLKFRASSSADPILLKSVMFKATKGDLASLTNLSLWRDTNGDGTADTKVLDRNAQNSTGGVLVFFSDTVAQHRIIAANQSAVFEVRGDIAAGATGAIQIGLKTDLANFVGALNQTSGDNLGGIKANGLCLFTCEIEVTTVPSVDIFILSNNGSSSSSSSFTSSSGPPCGNGQRDGSEECDDRNTTPGDGCSATCTREPGWSCIGFPSSCFIENFSSSSSSSSSSAANLCGNKNIDAGEQCDDGNQINTDDCNNQCRLTVPLPDF